MRARADRIAAHARKRANDFNLGYNPTSVRFNPDWTYTSTYRHGECSNRGGWYASLDGDLATSPVSPCDHRSRVVGSPDTGEWLTLELLGPDELMVNHELYIPEQKAMPRAVVRYFLGYQDSATLRLEYDMPIRAGKLAHLDFTVGNAGKRPLTFQRIGLTKEYHTGRRPDGSLDVPEEIAGKDLAGRELEPGKSMSLSLDVTFPNAGSQWVYFNLMVRDANAERACDIQQGHEVRVE